MEIQIIKQFVDTRKNKWEKEKAKRLENYLQWYMNWIINETVLRNIFNKLNWNKEKYLLYK